MDNINRFKAWVSAVMALLTTLWGWFGWLVIAGILCMGLDIFTGMASAAKDGEWSSKIAREGLLHKGGCIVVVAVSGILDLVVGLLLRNMGDVLPFNYTVFLCPMVVFWYILTEIGSIIENAGKMGAAVPKWLKSAIALFKSQVDDAADISHEKHKDENKNV